MRRLYLQIYVAFVGIVIFFGVLIMLAWFLIPPRGQDLMMFEGVATLAGELLPASDEPIEELQSKLERIGSKFPADIAVHDPDGRLLASIGERLPPPNPNRKRSGWVHSHRAGPAAVFLLLGRAVDGGSPCRSIRRARPMGARFVGWHDCGRSLSDRTTHHTSRGATPKPRGRAGGGRSLGARGGGRKR